MLYSGRRLSVATQGAEPEPSLKTRSPYRSKSLALQEIRDRHYCDKIMAMDDQRRVFVNILFGVNELKQKRGLGLR
jgi:hypothetical protein